MNEKELEVLDRISTLLKDKKLTQKSLCEYIGLKDKIFSEWKAGNNTSYMKKLPQIAEFFNVSVAFLYGEQSEKEKNSANTEFSEKDIMLVEAYHKSEPVIQSAVDKLLGIEEKTYTVKIAARDGSFQERVLTETEWKKLQDLPDADL